MLVIGFPALAFATNCYVIATGAGQECLVIDPGIGVVPQLEEVLTQNRLKPAAVLATHAHLDHVFSVTPVCGAHGVALSVHEADRYRLSDPAASLGPQLRMMFEQQFGTDGWSEPDDIVTLTGKQRLTIAGIDIDVIHAPGHTEGSVLLGLDYTAPQQPITRIVFTGDVVFAGSVGRTDLPGGDPRVMSRTLNEVVLLLADTSALLPGHGGQTTMARERVENPYLQTLPARN